MCQLVVECDLGGARADPVLCRGPKVVEKGKMMSKTFYACMLIAVLFTVGCGGGSDSSSGNAGGTMEGGNMMNDDNMMGEGNTMNDGNMMDNDKMMNDTQ